MSDLVFVFFLIATLVVFMVIALIYRSKRAVREMVVENQSVIDLVEISGKSEKDLGILPMNFKNLVEIPDLSNLHEVKDLELVSRLDAFIPNALNTMAQWTNRIPKDVVKIDIPVKDLTKSKAVKGALRAFSRGKDGISKNANLTPIDISKGAQVANIAAGAMNVAALIVGQQMMSEINAKLAEISSGINRLEEFAVAELKAKILSDVALVMEIGDSQIEIMENDELRMAKLSIVDILKHSISQNLGHVNGLISGISSKTNFKKGSKGFKLYESEVARLSDLLSWQAALIALLEQISKLSYTLGRGTISIEKSNRVFANYLEVSEKVGKSVVDWHGRQVKALGINLDYSQANKGFIEAIPGLVNENWKYISINEGLSKQIELQSRLPERNPIPKEESFKKDVELFLIDGKYYYGSAKN